MMKRYLMVAALALVMAGCGSNVKLDPPVQGSDATATGAAGGGKPRRRPKHGDAGPGGLFCWRCRGPRGR